MKTHNGDLNSLPANGILVFGSNTQGRHGKGTALLAKQRYGAIQGQPIGLQGKSYGVVTKDLTKKIHPSMPTKYILLQIKKLYEFAKAHPNLDFYVPYRADTQNLNNYTPHQMAAMFSDPSVGPIPTNIVFEHGFSALIR